MIFEILALVVSFGAIAMIVAWTVLTGSPPTPTSPRVRRSMMAILPTHLPSSTVGQIYELGSGWGGISRTLADHFNSTPVIGIEISPLPFAISWLRNFLSPKSNLKLSYGDFFDTDLSDARLIVCYLSRDALIRLAPKLERELVPEALILSNSFGIPGWRTLDKSLAPDLYRSPVYLYERGEAVAR